MIERFNVRELRAGVLPYAPEVIVADLAFISLRKVLPALLACAAPRYDALCLVKPQFEVGRERVGRGGVVRDGALRRRAMLDVADAARELGASVRGFLPSGLPGPKGNIETFVALAEGGRGSLVRSGGGRVGGRSRMSRRAITVFTHGRPEETAAALRDLAAMAAAAGAVLTLDADETAKHPGAEAIAGLQTDMPLALDAELCVALGGDGTILRALRSYARTAVPVFAVNFGEVGFLSTVEPDRMSGGLRTRAGGDARRVEPAGDRVRGARRARTSRSTTSRCTARSAAASPSSPTPSAARRSAASAATASSSPRRPDRPATTSPTAGR